MALANDKRKVQVTADGSVGPFTFDFLIFLSSHLVVESSDADGTNAVLHTEITDYTVSGVGNPAGGEITFVGGQQPASGKSITMRRVVPLTQLTDYVENDAFPAETHERGLDLLTMIAQQLQEQSDRSLVLTTTTPLSGLQFPDPSDPNNQNKAIVITGPTTLGVVEISAGGDLTVLGNKGELISHDGSGFVAVPPPTSGTGQVLTEDNTAPSGLSWQASGAGGPEGEFKGVVLTNLVNQDTLNDVVTMENAEYIVTDAGTLVRPQRVLSLNFNSTGVGGIDNGVRTTNRWYGIYYIFRGATSGTPDDPANPTADALLAVREPLFQFVEFSTLTGTNTRLRDFAARTKVSQGFTHNAANGFISHVMVRMAQIGSPIGNVWFTIETDSGGVPSGTVIATSRKKRAERMLAGTTGDIAFDFPRLVPITSGVTYHIVAQADYAISGINHLAWEADNANTYAGGAPADFNGSVWTPRVGEDMFFRLNGISNTGDVGFSTPVMPAGYTERTLIGFAFNRTGPLIKPFISFDREIICESTEANTDHWFVDNVSVNRATLQNAAIGPPRKCLVDFVGGSGTANTKLFMGQFDNHDIGNADRAQTLGSASLGFNNIVSDNNAWRQFGSIFWDRSLYTTRANLASTAFFYVRRIRWTKHGQAT